MKLKAVAAPLARQMAELEALSQPANSTMAELAKRIDEQRKAIEAIKIPGPAHMRLPEPPSMPDIEMPPHPTHETNERLERIEARFEQMQGIATEAAAIANGLQGAAAEFLVKFERAAGDNDRATWWAIRIGAVAILIAVLAPLVQIVYTEVWRVPDDTAAMQAAVSEMKAEIAGLKEEQALVAERLAAALANADRDSATVLRDIRDLLGAMQPASAADPVPAE
jgi:hypothetical protein